MSYELKQCTLYKVRNKLSSVLGWYSNESVKLDSPRGKKTDNFNLVMWTSVLKWTDQSKHGLHYFIPKYASIIS